MEFHKFNFDKKEVKKGDLLLAEPFLSDPNFSRSVILVCEQNEDGFVGVILNKQIENIRLEDVVEPELSLEADLYLGGPVEKNLLHAVHIYGDMIEDSQPISEDLYFGGDFAQISQLISVGAIDQKFVRFFLGYSGWSEIQLNEEVNQNSWIITNSAKYDIFTMGFENLWNDVLKDMGGQYKVISNYPIDPNLN